MFADSKGLLSVSETVPVMVLVWAYEKNDTHNRARIVVWLNEPFFFKYISIFFN